MPIDRFTKAQFEKALPRHKDTDAQLWEFDGLQQGEYTYTIPVVRKDQQDVRIVIRSSIDASGLAAETGADSIRMWLEAGDCKTVNSLTGSVDVMSWKAVGKAAGRWTTRVPGWDERMMVKIKELYSAGRKLQRCESCGGWKNVYVVKSKESENKGRFFQKCRKCNDGFEWLT